MLPTPDVTQLLWSGPKVALTSTPYSPDMLGTLIITANNPFPDTIHFSGSPDGLTQLNSTFNLSQYS